MNYWKLFGLMSWLRCWLGDIMLRITRADKVNQVVTLEMDKMKSRRHSGISGQYVRQAAKNTIWKRCIRRSWEKEDLRKILQILIYWLVNHNSKFFPLSMDIFFYERIGRQLNSTTTTIARTKFLFKLKVNHNNLH